MGWSTVSPMPRPLLWDMNEAELTDGDASSRIGWAQVGLAGDVDPLGALPALGQCLDDALRRFGTITLAGLQVSIHNLRLPMPGQAEGNIFPDNWFNLSLPVWSKAHIAFDQTWAMGPMNALPTYFPHTGSFAFGPAVALPALHRIQIPAETPFIRNLVPMSLGLATTLPEWNASAASWALTLALHTARSLLPDARRHWAVRVTRVREELCSCHPCYTSYWIKKLDNGRYTGILAGFTIATAHRLPTARTNWHPAV